MKELKSGIEHLKQAKAHMSKANGIMSDHISKLKELEEENAELKAELDDWKGNAEGFEPDAYMRLPVDADGEPIRIGDVLYSSGNECRVVSITAKADEACVGVHTDDGVFLPSVNPKYLSRKNPELLEPEVLGADGVPIEVGDTVYCDDDPEQLIVDSFDDPGCVYLTLAKSPNGILYTIEPSRLSHECPDSWEKLEEDAMQHSCSYFGIGLDNASCKDCPHGQKRTGRTCLQNARLDMIARAKKLAGIEDESEASDD